MEFPQYRKYSNNKSFFEVLGEDSFRELKIIGLRYELIEIKATIWPERSYILDLLSNEGGYYETIEPDEFYKALDHCQSSMQPLH